MNIGIDISQIVFEGTGVGRFTHDLTSSLLQYDKTNKWTFFFSSLRQHVPPKIKEDIKQKGHKLCEFKLPPTGLSFIWNKMHRMNIENFIGKQDWFITSDWTEGPSHIKKTTIIHDLAYIKYPQSIHPSILLNQKNRIHWVQKESQIIFADSLSTKDDIISLLNMGEKKIYVNYPGVTVQKPTKQQISNTLRKHSLTKPFILTVGKIEPRKNIASLIEAYNKLQNKTIDLVIVGSQGWDKKISKKQSSSSNIKFLSFVSNVELFSLYSSCLLFVYPSLYEGFGYPIVEAMSLGAPVATSSTSSLKEIAGSSAALFDPLNVDSIVQTLNTIINDDQLRREFIKKGIITSKQYTWPSYIEKMITTLKINQK